MALKCSRVVDLCGKSNRFANFENTVDRGLAVNFGADFGFCLSGLIFCLVRILGAKRTFQRSFFSLGRLVNEFIQIISFCFFNEAHLNSGVRLLLELYCAIVMKHVAFFTSFAKLAMAFTFTT